MYSSIMLIMHGFLAGIMGFFMGIASFFHGGSMPPHINTQQATQQATVSATPAFGQRNRRTNLPAGEKPFFGTVTSVSGSVLTVQMQMGMRPYGNTVTPSVTPPNPPTITVDLNSSTAYTGGTQSDIVVNTKIAGIGKTNGDGSLIAVSIRINPSMQGGFPGQRGFPSGSTPIFGQVTSVSGNQLTVQRQGRNGNGTTITVDLTSNTQYANGSQTDIQTGTRIGGYGTSNSDGSINAQQITINPSFGNRGRNNGQ